MSEPTPMRAAISESKKSKHRFQIGAAIAKGPVRLTHVLGLESTLHYMQKAMLYARLFAKELDWKALLFISTGITIT